MIALAFCWEAFTNVQCQRQAEQALFAENKDPEIGVQGGCNLPSRILEGRKHAEKELHKSAYRSLKSLAEN